MLGNPCPIVGACKLQKPQGVRPIRTLPPTSTLKTTRRQFKLNPCISPARQLLPTRSPSSSLVPATLASSSAPSIVHSHVPQAPPPPSLHPAFSVLPRRDLLAALLHLRILRLFLRVALALLVLVVLLVLAVSLLPLLQSYIPLLRPVPAPPPPPSAHHGDLKMGHRSRDCSSTPP